MPRFVHYLYLVPLGLGAMISLRAFRLSWPRPYRLFSIFLVGTFMMELVAISWKLWLYQTTYWHYSKSNGWIYNLYYTPEYIFYLLFFYRVLEKNIVNRKIVFAACGLYIVLGIVNLLFIQRCYKLNTYSIIGGNIIVIFLTLLYFKQELQRTTPIRAVEDPLFWISIGAFIFHTVSLPYFIFINYLIRNNLSLAVTLFNILLFLNTLLYSLYLTAFLCKTPYQKKHTLQ